MDFSNRGPQPQHNSSANGQSTNSFAPPSGREPKNSWNQTKVSRIAQVILSACIVVVLIGLLGFIAYGNGNSPIVDNESKYIQSTKLQAVFLSTGQVYFGKIKSLNSNYLVLDNIYYLQTSSSGSSSSSSSSNTSVTLVKLGCELHAPLDQMVINRSQVTFWENLSPSGQVAKAVGTFQKDNPNGQKCTDQSTAASSTSTPQAATESTGTTTTTK